VEPASRNRGIGILCFSGIVGCVLALILTCIPKAIYQMVRNRTLPSLATLKLQFDGAIPALLGGIWGVFVGYVSGWVIGIGFFNDQMYAPLFTIIGGTAGGCIMGLISGAWKLNIGSSRSSSTRPVETIKRL
jgi:hypothetical protein